MGLHRRFAMTMTRASSASSGDEVITGLGGKPAIAIISAVDDANNNVNSNGFDDGTTCICNYTQEVSFLTTILGALGVGSLTKNVYTSSVVINNAGNGWSAKITSLGVDGCTVSWTKIGSGRNITVKIYLIL